MTDLTLKFNLLEPDAKKQVLDFMEFLLSKGMKSDKPPKSDYKKKILKVSVWNDADIDLMIQNQQQFNQWKALEWYLTPAFSKNQRFENGINTWNLIFPS